LSKARGESDRSSMLLRGNSYTALTLMRFTIQQSSQGSTESHPTKRGRIGRSSQVSAKCQPSLLTLFAAGSPGKRGGKKGRIVREELRRGGCVGNLPRQGQIGNVRIRCRTDAPSPVRCLTVMNCPCTFSQLKRTMLWVDPYAR
jgi:hypothetical protein